MCACVIVDVCVSICVCLCVRACVRVQNSTAVNKLPYRVFRLLLQYHDPRSHTVWTQ